MYNEYKNSVLKRFHLIFHSTGRTKQEFARLLEISGTMLGKYYSGKSDLKHLTDKLIDLGFSVDWLYTGEGEMILIEEEANNDLSYLNYYDKERQKERIEYWIVNTFKSIEIFEKEAGFEKDFIRNFLYNNDNINYDIVTKLRKQGCNILWTITGNGDKFLENRLGKKNYIRYLDNNKGNLLK